MMSLKLSCKDNGADDLLFPEQEMAEHLAKQMQE